MRGIFRRKLCAVLIKVIMALHVLIVLVADDAEGPSRGC